MAVETRRVCCVGVMSQRDSKKKKKDIETAKCDLERENKCLKYYYAFSLQQLEDIP